MINEIEKNSDETGSGEKPDTLNQTPGQSVMIATEPDNTDPAGVIFLLEEDTIPSEDKVVFMDPGFRIPEYSDLLELDLDEDHEIIFQSEETSDGIQDNMEEYSRKQLQSELIDKFIVSNPRIEPQKDKTYISNDVISKPFIEESGSLVTETLAKIYVNQGYYSKAIDIYEKLSLKFPEKSSYFATQIENVKELIK
jgi:tetratricopeptide (TPR) repeat protein